MSADAFLRISADLGNLDVVRRFVRENAAGLGQNPDALQGLIQAVDESVTNIIVHGYRGQPGSIEIKLEEAEGCMGVGLRVEGPTFAPAAGQGGRPSAAEQTAAKPRAFPKG